MNEDVSRPIIRFVHGLGLAILLIHSLAIPAFSIDEVATSDDAIYLPLVSNNACNTKRAATAFGVQMYGATGEKNPNFADLVASRASWVRVPIYWQNVEPRNVETSLYNWTAADQAVGAVQDGCFNLIITHDLAPSWAASDPFGPIDRTDISELVEYLAALVERYDGDGIEDAPGAPVVNYLEIYNEPDATPSPLGVGWGYEAEQYAAMLKAVYPAIKAANPNAEVLLGGIAYDWFEDQGGPFATDFLDNVLEAGGGAYFDIMNFHTYPPFASNWATQGPGLLEKTLFIRQKLKSYGLNKPIVITETCHHNNTVPGFPGSDEIQMRYVVELYTQSLAADVLFTIWFPLVDVGGDYPFNSGLVSNKIPAMRKLAFNVFQLTASELSPTTFVRKLPTSETKVPEMEAYEFVDRSRDVTLVVAWLDPVDTNESRALSLQAPAVTIRNLFNGTNVVEDSQDGNEDGNVKIAIGGRPVFVEMIRSNH